MDTLDKIKQDWKYILKVPAAQRTKEMFMAGVESSAGALLQQMPTEIIDRDMCHYAAKYANHSTAYPVIKTFPEDITEYALYLEVFEGIYNTLHYQTLLLEIIPWKLYTDDQRIELLKRMTEKMDLTFQQLHLSKIFDKGSPISNNTKKDILFNLLFNRKYSNPPKTEEYYFLMQNVPFDQMEEQLLQLAGTYQYGVNRHYYRVVDNAVTRGQITEEAASAFLLEVFKKVFPPANPHDIQGDYNNSFPFNRLTDQDFLEVIRIMVEYLESNKEIDLKGPFDNYSFPIRTCIPQDLFKRYMYTLALYGRDVFNMYRTAEIPADMFDEQLCVDIINMGYVRQNFFADSKDAWINRYEQSPVKTLGTFLTSHMEVPVTDFINNDFSPDRILNSQNKDLIMAMGELHAVITLATCNYKPKSFKVEPYGVTIADELSINYKMWVGHSAELPVVERILLLLATLNTDLSIYHFKCDKLKLSVNYFSIVFNYGKDYDYSDFIISKKEKRKLLSDSYNLEVVS